MKIFVHILNACENCLINTILWHSVLWMNKKNWDITKLFFLIKYKKANIQVVTVNLHTGWTIEGFTSTS